MILKALAAVVVVLLSAQSLAAQASLAKAAWLVGCWEMNAENRRVVERWAAPQEGVMSGSSRTFIGGVPRESEKLRLFVAADTFVYESTPSGQQRTEFRAPAISDREMLFSNPAHDFPQRILYHRTGPDSLVARIEGDRDGRRGPVSFPYRRVECTPEHDMSAAGAAREKVARGQSALPVFRSSRSHGEKALWALGCGSAGDSVLS